MTPPRTELLLVGGGLQNGLLALWALRRLPGARVTLVESGDRLGGNHTWCFHGTDVAPPVASALADLVAVSWDGHEVAFPTLSRSLPSSYHLISSDRLHDVVSAEFARRPSSRLILGQRAASVRPHAVDLEGGERLEADWVVDSRGPEALGRGSAAGYQEFLGLELEVDGLTRRAPLLMDARVPQAGAFHFVYVLPLGPGRVLIEDTWYSRAPGLDREAARSAVLSYAAKAGLSVRRTLREEWGSLPLSGLGAPADQRDQPGLLRGGYAGGWFHPTTGYSLPVAARFADVVVGHLRVGDLLGAVTRLRREVSAAQRPFGLLNEALFRSWAPSQRYVPFERFHSLSPELIARFYRMAMTPSDWLRVLWTRPLRGLVYARGAAAGVPS